MKQLDFNDAQKFCVFQSGGSWLGLPALRIRQVAESPSLTPVPNSDPILKGICYRHNEFIPVVCMRALMHIQYDSPKLSEQQLLLLTGNHASWALLIDHVIALADLETTISTFSKHDDQWSSVTVGSASFRDQVLQVLDADALLHYASHLFVQRFGGPMNSLGLTAIELSCLCYFLDGQYQVLRQLQLEMRSL